MGFSKHIIARWLFVLCLFQYGTGVARPAALVAEESPEAAIFDQALKEAAQELAQQRKNQIRPSEQVRRKPRFAGPFEMLLSRARAQYARILRWQSAHPKELKIRATVSFHKKRFQVAVRSVQ
ncbi:MAG: hypothetical protein WBG50_02940 [Desulfomonilaceae bacterium]